MDHMLQLHVEHHSSLKHCDPVAARFRERVDASWRVVVLAFAAIASLALFLQSFSVGRPPLSSAPALPAAWLLAAAGSLVTTKTALFVLSNAIFVLLAADCRWFFFTSGASADNVDAREPCDVVPEKQEHHHQEAAQRCAVQSRVPYPGCLEHKNSSTASEEFTTEPVTTIYDSTTTLEALEEQEDERATSRTELLGRLDEADSVALELEAVVVEEPTCETARGLDELEIDELNKKFDEFIQSRRNKWIKEETNLLKADVIFTQALDTVIT
ncbi:hypothetical protein BAE44_0009250 [Dichanthelium oligosanthes]|uniref:Uncharacterized protein n=1 Tax=Dichanthelium oligosanthes TaxID=888268 RepID=A0A1E5VXA2_9POAL|nr:hypothetical protein BAE44_0009250 [Dichanthelium oligosanthes]